MAHLPCVAFAGTRISHILADTTTCVCARAASDRAQHARDRWTITLSRLRIRSRSPGHAGPGPVRSPDRSRHRVFNSATGKRNRSMRRGEPSLTARWLGWSVLLRSLHGSAFAGALSEIGIPNATSRWRSSPSMLVSARSARVHGACSERCGSPPIRQSSGRRAPRHASRSYAIGRSRVSGSSSAVAFWVWLHVGTS